MAGPSLAIAIPAYCRAAILSQHLVERLEELRAHDIAVYVSDDSPDAETRAVIESFRELHPRTHYRQNAPSLGHDQNLLATLSWPGEDYVWLIGDGGMATSAGLAAFFALANNQDFIFVNSHADGVPTVPFAEGEGAKVLIRQMLWHQTLTGATIYNRRVVEWARAPGAVEIKRNFPQLSVILGYASLHPVTAAWIGDRGVAFSNEKKSYWVNSVFPIFVDDLHAAVSGYPAVIGAEHYSRVMRSHSHRTGLLGALNLAWLRVNGRFGRKEIQAHPRLFDASSAGRATIHVIANSPRWLLMSMNWLKTLLKRGD